MALIEEFDKSGNWLFRWRSFLPLILYILAALVIVAGEDNHLPHFNLTWATVCAGVSLFGLIIRAVTIGYTPRKTSGRNTAEGQVAEVLNTKNIYSTVRHPLYLGNFFMWLGIIIYVGNWWFTLVCCLLFWIYYERIMFAEEFFLRKKFGQEYLTWSLTVPPFLPKLFQWQSSGDRFSIRNVLKREYNGFFAIFLSFFLIDLLKNWMRTKSLALEDLVHQYWLYPLVVSLITFIVLRTLKRMTRVLHVEGR